MSPYALLAQLSLRGIRLWEDRGRLRYHAPDEDAFPPDLKASVRANRAELLDLLRRSGPGSGGRQAIPRAGGGDIPASHEQQRFLILDALRTGAAGFNLTSAFRLRGAVDIAALEKAVADTVARHGALRTRFAERQGKFIQLAADFHPTIERVDLGGGSGTAAMAQISAAIESRGRAPFDLMAGPHLRVMLYRISDADHVLAVIMHHVVSDGGSIALFVEELRSHYAIHRGVAVAPRPAPRRQYLDYAAWQHGAEAARLRRRHLDYWRARLKHLPAPLGLPTRRRRGPDMSDEATLLFIDLDRLADPDTGARRGLGVTRFHLLLAAFAVVLEKYGGRDDFIIGTPMSSRMGPELDDTIGPFLNMVPLRLKVRKSALASDLIADIGRIVVEALDHAAAPFDAIVDAVGAPRDGAFMPIFQTMFVLEDTPVELMTLPGLDVETLVFDDRLTKYDLTLMVQHRQGRWVGILKYNSALFDPALMAQMARHFRAILAALGRGGDVRRGDVRVGDIRFLDDAERARLLKGWDGPAAGQAPDKSLPRLFAEAAGRFPNGVAVESEAGRLTYGELDALTDRLAARLGERRVGVGDFIAVAMDRSTAAVVTIIGVLKAGAAIVPVDPDFPAARRREMVELAGCKLVLTDRPGRSPAPNVPKLMVSLASLAKRKSRSPLTGPPAVAGDGACVYYTSGSAGAPKAVVLDHRSMVNNLSWMQKDWPLSPDDAVLLKAPLGFDVSLKEIFWPLLAGARLVVAAPGGHRDPAYLRRTVAGMGVTVIHLVPAMLDHFLAGAGPEIAGLRIVMTGGEALSEDLKQRFHRRSKALLLHLYGPTEAAIAVTGTGLGADQSVHLGHVTPNSSVHVLDDAGRLPPPGVAGEIHIGGVALAWGYLGDARLTADRFRPDPFAATPGGRLYRSGDRARRSLDGKLHFIGRADRQLKIGGLRIEPGEVEATLRRHPAVAAAAVTPGADGASLVAHVTARGGPRPDPAELAQFAGRHLPRHLVPSRIHWLDALPLSDHGKIDYQALGEDRPETDIPVITRPVSAGRHNMEERLTAAWRRVLGHHAFSTTDNFFEVGGSSLLLVNLQRHLRDDRALEIATADFFAYPTIAALAAHLTAADPPPAPAPAPKPPAAAATRDVAIIGYAARMPGCKDLKSFWDTLCAGGSAIVDIAADDLRAAGVPEATLRDPTYIRRRAVLDGVDRFDAEFFRMTPGEAALLDPQARLLLELTQEALDHAAHGPAKPGDRVGVFVASGRSSYFLNNIARVDGFMSRFGPQQLAIATDKCFLATRISYKFGFRGPAITVDTACSSSLVAVHQARMAILNGECDAAVAGGAAVDVPVRAGYFCAEGNIGSKSGHCRPFDAAADGTVKGSGAALVLLKRLDRARADGDRIRAVIKGSAVNNDGADKMSFTAPGVHGQEAVITAALADAGLAADDIDYLEAHGTGTALGDPIELEALGRVFGAETRLVIGSVKGNIGHLDAAAGIAGMIKAILIAEARVLPPSGGFTSMTGRAPPGAAAITVNSETVPVGSGDDPARIGVSSFGIGGTNAHVVIESVAAPVAPVSDDRPELLQLSAPTAASLVGYAQSLAAYAERLASIAADNGPVSARAMALTLALGRRRFGFRTSIIATRRTALAAALRRATDRIGTSPAPAAAPAVALLLPGRASGGLDRLAPLMASFPAYRDRVEDRLAGLPAADRTRVGYFFRETAGVDKARAEGAPSAVFLHGLAFHELLAAVGIRPDYLVGPGLGELTAAVLAGVMDPELALNLLAERERRAPAATAVAARLAGAKLEAPRLPFVSTLAGNWITADQATDPDYWARWLQPAARPDAAPAKLFDRQDVVVLDVGPGKDTAGLAMLGRRDKDYPAISFTPSDHTGADRAMVAVLEGLGKAWEAGVENRWYDTAAPERRHAAALPGPPFIRARHWIEAPGQGRPLAKSIPAATDRKPDGADPRSLVREIWRAQLGTERVADDDDFFALGGDSLGAAHILARMRELTGTEMSVADFYAAPTIAACLDAIEPSGQPEDDGPSGKRESIEL